MSSASNNTISEFEAFAEKASQDIQRTVSNIRGKSRIQEWKMAVIAINKILDEVGAKYLAGAKVPSVVIAAEMQMFPIDQVVTRGWPLLQAILKPDPEVNTHVWAQLPKSILKGKGVDPLERGGAMEAGGSKLEGKQASDGNQGRKGGEKGKKKEKKEKKEKKIERVAMGSNGGQESQVVGSESGGPISGGDLGAGTAEEHRGRTRDRKPKKHSQTQSQSRLVLSPRKGPPSLEPGPSPSKKAKASVSRSRPKTSSLTQKAKFTNDAGVTPSSSIKVYHPLSGPPPRSIPRASALELIATPINPILDPRPGPSSDPMDQIIKGLEVRVTNLEKQVERIPDLELQLSSMAWVVKALREQVTGPASLGLSPDADTPVGNGQFPSKIPFPHIGGHGSALIPTQPSVGWYLCRWRQVGTVPPPSSHAPTASSGCGDGG
ncbi:hypothetical protein PAXRUDRAFT_21375 [Paxillus rubicundulus Ve08.2h10]|uniref:Uncharacterized protein n=1 Tax=Paxillus rubicundulus Ve08.2h10 TaxID=930991 RepID=A0A0D0CZS4_9AGAM|nr:hypothetical protein PAXRUDRAFT_21375 [Paxillus rubicundulus Ve08.2h10]